MITTEARRSILLAIALALLTTLLADRPALAIDGQFPLSAAGGEGIGLPISLTQSGSYVLQGNITADGCFDAIDIKVSGVTINLNGFSVIGGNCGSGTGINAFSSGSPLITIYNGVVTKFGGDGIAVAHSSTVYGVRAFGNGGHGIFCTDGCQIFDNIANNNGSEGIGVAGSGLVSDNVTQFNAQNGIHVFDFSLVLGNTASHNGANGIIADSDSTGGSSLRDNIVCANGVGLLCHSSNTGYSDNQLGCFSGSGGDANGTNVSGPCTDFGD
jgi:hypothetical protein